MKYIKTYENFSYQYTNENWLWGEGNIWSQMVSKIKSWKNKKLAEGAENFQKWKEENPKKWEGLQKDAKPHVDKLTKNEKESILNSFEKLKSQETSQETSQKGEYDKKPLSDYQKKLRSGYINRRGDWIPGHHDYDTKKYSSGSIPDKIFKFLDGVFLYDDTKTFKSIMVLCYATIAASFVGGGLGVAFTLVAAFICLISAPSGYFSDDYEK